MMTSVSATHTPSSLDNAGFAKLWKSLYDPAFALAASTASPPNKVSGMLQSISKVLFGADESKKSICIVYGMGCLELSMKLVKSAQVGYPKTTTTTTTSTLLSNEQEAVWRSGLKVIKCSVIRCKVGRARCRMAGVFDYIGDLLDTFLNNIGGGGVSLDSAHVASMVEEAMTTLAAVCLGDDLNALQAAIQLGPYVDQAAIQYSSDDYPGMHQNIHYLVTLFDITVKQERNLLQGIDQETFFIQVATAERALWEATTCQRLQQYDKALEQYNTTLETIQSALSGDTTAATTTTTTTTATTATKLLDDLQIQLYQQRATVLLELQSYEAALEDANVLLTLVDGGESTARPLALKASALTGMGEVEQAKEALEAAIVANPQDEVLRLQLEKLSVVDD